MDNVKKYFDISIHFANNGPDTIVRAIKKRYTVRILALRRTNLNGTIQLNTFLPKTSKTTSFPYETVSRNKSCVLSFV